MARLTPRPENVVKAEALREAALSFTGGDRQWLERRADELGPPQPQECAHFLTMLAEPGERWKHGVCVLALGHGGEHLYRVTSERFGEPS